MPDREVDVVIVGAGAGGLAAARRLTSLGARVVLLESGKRYDPQRDYPQTGVNFEATGFPYSGRSDESGKQRHTFGAQQSIEPAWHAYCSRNQRSGPPPKSRAYRQYSHVRGVGGSTLHFQGEAHRYHPHALRSMPSCDADGDWPIAGEELARYYDIAEQLIGVAAPDVPQRPRRTPPTFPAHPLSYASQRLSAAFAHVGARLVPNSLAVLPQPYRGRRPCNYCNSCTQGCPLGDKGSADVTFLPEALATGRLEVLTQAHAFRIEVDERGLASAVLYADERGQHQRVAARYVVLAAGAIETPRLLLLSASSRATQGLSNSSGQVGRRLTETLSWVSIGLHPDRVDSFRGLPMDGTAWEFAGPDCAGADAPGFFRLATAHGAAGFRGPAGYAQMIPGFGVEHQRRMVDMYGHGVAVAAIGEWTPNASTHVDLDPGVEDAHGFRVARISAALGPRERALLKRMADTVRAIFEAAAVKDIVAERSSLDAFEATHVLGTCRMGASRDDSVADPEGFSYDVKNLAFADGSVVPSSGWGDSPFLTITALALRTADALMARAKLRAT